MANLTTSTDVSATFVRPQQRLQERKRNRIPVACNNCRLRKLKCSRTAPCESCVKSGDKDTCVYVKRSSYETSLSLSAPKTKESMESRLKKLEQLVKSALKDNSSTNEILNADIGGKDQNLHSILDSFGFMKIEPDESTHYLGSGHWLSIMSEIDEFKDYYLNTANEDEIDHDLGLTYPHGSRQGTSSLLRGTGTPATREQLLSRVPPRIFTDYMVQNFFASHMAMCSHFIHEPTFMKAYYEHWNDPSKTSIAWLGMFFSMMNVAEIAHEDLMDEPARNKTSSHWYERNSYFQDSTIECLIASNYTTPSKYTIETLMLYIEAEWMKQQDTKMELSLVLGMTIRLAMGMGIHRDSKRHPLSVFQGEMRRRLWATIHTKDILYASQLSLPAIIQSSDCDCDLPRNILDTDFCEISTELPPNRDHSSPSKVALIITKYRKVQLLSKISKFAESGKPLDHHGQVDAFRKELEEDFESTPPHLKKRSPEEMKMSPRWLVIQQNGMDRLHQMTKCTLHRKFIAPAHRTPTPQLLEYRRSCIDAAMALLNHQALLYEVFSNYHTVIMNRHISSLTSHDFYIADMTIALDLHYGIEFHSHPSSNQNQHQNIDIKTWGYDKRREMITLLEISNEYWRLAKDVSMEASKAHQIFSYILRKVKGSMGMIESPTVVANLPNSNEGNGAVNMGDGYSDSMFAMDKQVMLDLDWNFWDEQVGEDQGFWDFSQ